MKGDFTRDTFDPRKHYRSVRMQQGRVQMDADWNEQLDLTAHRVETGTVDLVGGCGMPLHDAGFHVVAAVGDLTAEEKTLPENANAPAVGKGDFLISGGRAYVGGALVENERIVLYSKQPDLPGAAPLAAGVYLLYLDVWARHLTILDDPAIADVALGGPDTGTREKTVWQVKCLAVGKSGSTSFDCLSGSMAWDNLIAPSKGGLMARVEPDPVSDKPCIVAPEAGYRRLENQLYRVEIHAPGGVGQATFKWSRDNGSVVTAWTAQSADAMILTVGSAGRDSTTQLAAGQWVELTDDRHDLLGLPGTLVRLAQVEGKQLTLDPATATGTIKLADFPGNPRVRRWDAPKGVDLVTVPTGATGGFLALEDGVQVHFQAGATYRTGDYWLIPARTNTGDVEWPRIGTTPVMLPPRGISHAYGRLAVVDYDGTNPVKVLGDCRNLFPPATETLDFSYLGGDGQEAMPDPTPPVKPVPLAAPLRVGVTRGGQPAQGASVRFSVTAGNGGVGGAAQTAVTVVTGADGVASCAWSLDGQTANQQAEATLLTVAGKPAPALPGVRFTASLRTAAAVSYDPANTPALAGITTVQGAIDALGKADGGGCCCVSVGPGADYKDIREAITKLRKNKVADICLCLLPGDHILSGSLLIQGDHDEAPVRTLRIQGSGDGSRLSLQGDGTFQARGLGYFALADLSINANDPATKSQLVISSGRVSITGCVIGLPGYSPVDLVTIDSGSIYVANNTFTSNARGVYARLPDTTGVYKDLDKVAEPSQEVAARLVGASAATRVKALADLKGYLATSLVGSPAMLQLANENIATIERTTAVSSAVNSPQAISELAKVLGALTWSDVLVLLTAGGTALIRDNIFSGNVRLYGGKGAMSADAFTAIAKLALRANFNEGNYSGSLSLLGNQLTRIVLDQQVAEATKGGSNLPGLRIWNRLSLTDNVIRGDGNQWLARTFTASGNHFDPVAKSRSVGVAVSQYGVIVGNSGDPNVPLATGMPPTIPYYQVNTNIMPVKQVNAI